MGTFVIGVDLGQAQDYTALCVLEYVPPAEIPRYMQRRMPRRKQAGEYHCRHLERLPLGTRYPQVVSRVAQMLRTPELKGAMLVVDGTGVGRAVIDMFADARLEPVAVSITAGDSVVRDRNYYRVPKRDLVSAVQVALQESRLKFAESLPMVGTLIDEMLAFKVKITEAAHDTYGSWREGTHDDLVLAVMLAVWWIQHLERNTPSPEELDLFLDAFRW